MIQLITSAKLPKKTKKDPLILLFRAIFLTPTYFSFVQIHLNSNISSKIKILKSKHSFIPFYKPVKKKQRND